jgi:uncharacterized protein DUF3293
MKNKPEQTVLWDAYRRTTYVAHTGHGDIRINPGRRSTALDGLLNERRLREWAYLTAYNPASRRLAEEENARRQRELVETVRDRGLAFLDGEGIGEDAQWPAEPSILILGIESDDARALGRQFGQLAIVVGRTGEPARLVACDDP